MYLRNILNILSTAQVFDIAKTLHKIFPILSTQRIYELILQVDSVDIAVEALFMFQEGELDLNEIVYLVLYYKDINEDNES